MTDIIVERSFEAPVAESASAGPPEACLTLHKVAQRGCLVSQDGRRMLCRFEAPDAESVRLALRQAGATADALWSATRLDGPASGAGPSNVVAVHRFDEPADPETLRHITDAGGWYARTGQMAFDHAYIARDGQRLLCFYRAAAPVWVWFGLRHSNVEVDAVWGFRRETSGGPESVHGRAPCASYAPV